jgi:hypothetical protein
VKGFRFVGEAADGGRVETVVGPAGGEYERPIEIKTGVEIVGVSGKHGLVINSLRLHLSDGTISPSAGGTGGGDEFRLLLRKRDSGHLGQVTGFFGLSDQDSLTGIGLLMASRDGVLAELDAPERLTLTTRGEVDAGFAPTVGRLTALFYEGYPRLLERFDDPQRPTSREITLVFKRGMNVPAYCSGSEVSINIDWLKRHPEDIALLTHELTHTVQHYGRQRAGWLVEGIADYARNLYGPKVQPGWALPAKLTARQNYKDGYRTTGRVLLWLDEKHTGLVDKVHRRLQSREFTIGDFQEFTGRSVDDLWAECLVELSEE